MINYRGRSIAVSFGARAVLAMGGWGFATDPLRLAPESKLWVDGTSNVRSFSCAAAVVTATIETSADSAVPAVLGGRNAVLTVSLSVPADRLDCHNGQMNEHMLKALKAKEHPVIAFTLDSYDLVTRSDTTKATLRGTLDLGGVTKPIVMGAELTAGTDGAMRIVGTYELNMKEYDLSPPSLLFGTMKVREKVKVKFDLMVR